MNTVSRHRARRFGRRSTNVGGKLAQIGSRLIDGTARKMADDFFCRFAALVDASNEPPQTPPEPAPAPAQPTPSKPAEEPVSSAASEPAVVSPTQPSVDATAAATSPAALSRSLWVAIAILVLAACYFALG